jgi:2-dehydro-3-deoxyphosphogluconate aldolase/(4S)-4-hydroxy-2-oxoglutarate aldolase
MRVGPVIPVLVIEDLAQAVPLAQALVAGGVRVLEVTLAHPRGAGGDPGDGPMRCRRPSSGVGTLTRPEDFTEAREAGARFGVSPGLTPALIAAARESGLPLLPGVMTPSEVIAARLAGFRELKLFPARQAGGMGMLQALAGPFPDVTFCPTGGITAETAPEFLALPNVGCVGGSWLTPKAALATGDWGRITELAREANGLKAR